MKVQRRLDRETPPAAAVRRRAAARVEATPSSEAGKLQRTAGNAATASLFGKGPEGDETVKGRLGVLQRDDTTTAKAAPARVSQDVTVSPIGKADDLGCGGFRWKVWFSIGAPAGADGWVIQEITADATWTKKDGTEVKEPYHYWEAWQLKKGKKTTIYQDEGLDDNDDMYYTPSRPAGSKGKDVTLGKARFFEGALPADFKQNNPATVAGILYSSATQPDFWSGSMADHNLTCTWDDTVKPSRTDVKTTPT